MTSVLDDLAEEAAPPTLRSSAIAVAVSTPLPRSWMTSPVSSWEQVTERFRPASSPAGGDAPDPPVSGARRARRPKSTRSAEVDGPPASSEAGSESGEVVEDDWEAIEPAMRFGFAARLHFAKHHVRLDEVEPLLQREWEREAGSEWERARRNVRRGWNAAGRKP